MNPRQFFFRINVFGRRKILRMIETSSGDVDLIGPTFGLVSERRPARVEESSECPRFSFVSMRFASFEFEVAPLYDHPGHRLRPGGAQAVAWVIVKRSEEHTSELQSR